MNWNRSRNFNSNQPLTIEQIGQFAPSALAIHAHESRCNVTPLHPHSRRDPEGMMNPGFQPFKASHSVRLRASKGKGDFTKHIISPLPPRLAPSWSTSATHPGSGPDQFSRWHQRLQADRRDLPPRLLKRLIIADSTIGSVSVQHKGNILDNVIEGSYRIISDSQVAMDRVAQWSNLQLTTGEQSL